MKNLLLTLLGIFLLGTAIVGVFEATAMSEEIKTMHMKIKGMTCGWCEAQVKRRLSTLCNEITIDREKGEGTCKYEAPVQPDQILFEANKTGFKTTEIK